MNQKVKCWFGKHHYHLEHYVGIYGGQVPYLKCDGCGKEVLMLQGKREARQIERFMAKATEQDTGNRTE